jgi:2-polyprenyl-3-methyl-5-hydroxy-6-metoxy-1,4-benzoquinol methylase
VSSSWSYLDPVVLPLLEGETVLDVGCGLGRWGTLIHTNYWEAKLDHPPAVDGFDGFAPNVDYCRRHGAYRRVWEQLLPDRLDGEWDTVLAVEIVEHIAQDAVFDVIDELERVARRRIVISTPNSPHLRGGLDTPVGFNALEAHVSYVSAHELRRRGYEIRGVGFGRYNSRLALTAKRYGLRPALTTIPFRLPALAETIVAYKDVAQAP